MPLYKFLHSLFNVLVHIANKMGLQQIILIKNKRIFELNIKFRKIVWLLGRNLELSIYNKLILYKQVLRPVWSYGIQLWGCACDSNIQVIQRFQNKVLKCIVQAPWYIRNSDLHRDLRIETVNDIITRLASSHKKIVQNHINSEVSKLNTTQTEETV
jgi:hypothetical protein